MRSHSARVSMDFKQEMEGVVFKILIGLYLGFLNYSVKLKLYVLVYSHTTPELIVFSIAKSRQQRSVGSLIQDFSQELQS